MNFKEAYEYGKELTSKQQCPNPAAEYNEACLKALKIQIPQKVVIAGEEKYRSYNPARCSNCDYELSYFEGDGIYLHPEHLKMCPECGQKLHWR